jgi:hypothetical protein
MPFFGLKLLPMARDVAAFNLPARVGHPLRGQPLRAVLSRVAPAPGHPCQTATMSGRRGSAHPNRNRVVWVERNRRFQLDPRFIESVLISNRRCTRRPICSISLAPPLSAIRAISSSPKPVLSPPAPGRRGTRGTNAGLSKMPVAIISHCAQIGTLPMAGRPPAAPAGPYCARNASEITPRETSSVSRRFAALVSAGRPSCKTFCAGVRTSSPRTGSAASESVSQSVG